MPENKLNDIALQFRAMSVALGKVFEQWMEKLLPLARQIEDFRTRIHFCLQQMAPQIEEMLFALKELPEKNRNALRSLAKNGWYLDLEWNFSDLFETAALFDSGATDQANNKLCDHFDSRLEEIEQSICARFPDRARVLKQAFEAHRRKEFALSIPVFLAQADGICNGLVGTGLYGRKDGQPRLAKVLTVDPPQRFRDLFLYPLLEANPISASSNEVKSGNCQNLLTRHPILHGESSDYDNRLNGCRSLSLLHFVASVL